MPDPVSSVTPSSTPNACVDLDSEAGSVCTTPATTASSANQPLMSEPDVAGVCTPPSPVETLVAQFTASTVPTGVTGGSANGVGYTYSGPTADGASTRTEVAFVKSPEQPGGTLGMTFQALDVAQVTGRDHDLQLTIMHGTVAVSHAGFGLSVAFEGPNARANLGEHNDDGSLGGNIGAGAEFLGVEATLDTPIGSLTAGESASLSLSGSIGVRDADHDGKPEFCAKFSIPAYTVGACLEQFW